MLGVRRYEMKRIVSHRVLNGRSEYWVQWEGYDASWDQWLHKDLEGKGVAEMLKVYHAQGGTAILLILALILWEAIKSRVARSCRLAVPPWRASWFVPVGAPRWPTREHLRGRLRVSTI